MPVPPPLSIVVPTHDTRELALACLRACLRAQESAGLPDLQIVVVDDASRDGTAEAVAAAHPGVEVLRRDPGVGFTRAANLGLARARGEILLLLNSDTEVEPGAFGPLLEAFRRDPLLGAAGAVLHYPDGRPQWSGGAEPGLLWLFALTSGLPALLARLPLYRRLKPAGAVPGGSGNVGWVTGAALAIRREAWERAVPLDESYRFYVQDLDVCVRLRQAGWRIELVPGFRVLHHHGATIGQKPGASEGRQNPELLWTDLLLWARRRHGESWARRAALAMRCGAVLRLLGRAALAPWIARDRRAAWQEESRAFGRALRALTV